MTQFDIERFVDELADYFKYSYNKEKLFSLLQEAQIHLYAYYDGEKWKMLNQLMITLY